MKILEVPLPDRFNYQVKILEPGDEKLNSIANFDSYTRTGRIVNLGFTVSVTDEQLSMAQMIADKQRKSLSQSVEFMEAVALFSNSCDYLCGLLDQKTKALKLLEEENKDLKKKYESMVRMRKTCFNKNAVIRRLLSQKRVERLGRKNGKF